ncbi:NAD-dependent epimerase/dehydratase family protein [bacterium]|nr:MAG: NAD-dependent epimerase/dehydratase family protein [bacterium]
MIEGKKVPLYGNGEQIREWIHVLDHCEGIFTVLERGTPGEVYNVGDENERPNREVTRILLEELGRDASLVKRIEDPRKGAHDVRYAMETEKLRALGWAPRRNFETELRATARWYRDHEPWWREIIATDGYQQFVRAFYGRSLGADL